MAQGLVAECCRESWYAPGLLKEGQTKNQNGPNSYPLKPNNPLTHIPEYDPKGLPREPERARPFLLNMGFGNYRVLKGWGFKGGM